MESAELKNLERISLVSKICNELENHIGIADKTLAEFLIDLAEKSKTQEVFRAELLKNGGEFPDSFVSSLFRLIQRLRPEDEVEEKKVTTGKQGVFPGLAIPDKPIWVRDLFIFLEKRRKKKILFFFFKFYFLFCQRKRKRTKKWQAAPWMS